MHEINERKLNLFDSGMIFLICVTLLLTANVVFALFVPQDILMSGNYYWLVGAAELLAVGVPPVVYLLVKKIKLKSVFKNRLSKEQAALSFFLAIFAYPVLVVLRLLWVLLLEALKVPQSAQPLAPIGNVPMFLVAVVAVSLLPGFSEELVFRGIMMERFRTKMSVTKAIIISALFFMLMHADISAWTYTFAAGVVLGIIYHITGSLWASIIYHSVNNLIGAVAAYIYSLLGYEDMLTQSYEATFQGQGSLLAVGVIVLVIAAAIFAGISFLLFWALKKVSPKKEPVERLTYKEGKITYVPYILGTFLLLVMTVLPVISQILQG